MICPKCHKPSKTRDECEHCGVIFVDINRGKDVGIDLFCPWNDHGRICGLKGSISESTNGSGPWYCSDHYWYSLKGWARPDSSKKPETYRERWYRERGLPFEKAKTGNMNPLGNP